MDISVALKRQPDRVHAMFVGIDEYEHLPQLTGCVNDATILSKAFTPIADSNVLLTDRSATRRRILEHLEDILGKAGKGDLVVLFCASHGTTRFREFFVLPHDALGDRLLSTGFSLRIVVRALGDRPDVRSLLVLDTCFSAGIGFDLTQYQPGTESAMMVSAAAAEPAAERHIDGQSHGYFAYHLAAAIRKAVETSGEVTIGSAFDEAYTNTKEESSNSQHPVFIGTLDYHTTLRTRHSEGNVRP